MTDNKKQRDDFRFNRRTALKSGTVAMGLLGMTGTATATADEDCDQNEGSGEEDNGVDSPEGFEVEVLAAHATFPDEMAAMFSATVDDTTLDSNLPCDASTLVFARANFEPGGRSGWHQHPGVGLVNVAEGEIEIQDAHDCSTRTYTAGEAFLDPAEHVHHATNVSDSDRAVVYVAFLGVPDGGPATEFVEPVDC